MQFTQFLAELANSKAVVKPSRLTYLSNLRLAEVEALREFWPQIPAERRLQIVRQLGELAEDNVDLDFNEVFKLGLRDEETEVRRLSLAGLWECEDRDLIGPLVELLRADESEDVRAAAAEGLGRYILLGELDRLRSRDVTRVVDTLLESVYDQDETVLVHRRVIEAVSGLSGEPRIQRVIEDAYHSSEKQMKISALFAMGHNCDQRWLPTLLRELDDEDPVLRFEAAGACGQLEDERAVPKLVRLINDPDRQVQLGAIDALGHIGGNLAKQALLRCRQTSDEEISQAAADALEELSFSHDPLSFGLGD